jgi:hypothetical protein
MTTVLFWVGGLALYAAVVLLIARFCGFNRLED